MNPTGPSPENIAACLTILAALYNLGKMGYPKLVKPKNDRFLDYDPGHLTKTYAGEHAVADGLTYTEICDFSKLISYDKAWNETAVEIRIANGRFIRSNGTKDWQETSSAGFTALLESGRIGSSEPAIRVSSAVVKQGRLNLALQEATYHDQAHSNLILDFDRDSPAKYRSLRSQLVPSRDQCLPKLSDRRLANTLGVAALIFYKHGDQWIQYIVRRVDNLAVFTGGMHCTASGVARWPENPNVRTLDNFATDHMFKEIEEEVGLQPTDIIELRPLALCREMARGGKPQLFYGGFTRLKRDALKERRIHARKYLKANQQVQEIARDRLGRPADVVLTPSELNVRTGKLGLTLEGAAALHYGIRYALARLPHLRALN